ncbi:hypothetical protein OAF61_03055 [Pseudomonadales bacterium]|nr:hypothetical protein [Pseudomonadales bacterium]
MYNTKFTTVQDYVSSAINMTQEDQTFAAKSHQKEALGELNSGYQMLLENNFQFSIDSLSREDYFAIPFDLHQIRDKHFRLFDEAHHADLTDLITFRVLLKELEVVKPAPKSDRITAKQAEVTETVVDLIERRMAQYHEAVEIGRLFGGLPVSVTPHQVTNEYNTTFTRCFYYLAGKFTPLSVIMAAADKLAREKEEA